MSSCGLLDMVCPDESHLPDTDHRAEFVGELDLFACTLGYVDDDKTSGGLTLWDGACLQLGIVSGRETVACGDSERLAVRSLIPHVQGVDQQLFAGDLELHVDQGVLPVGWWQAEALAQSRNVRQFLADELGVEPGDALQALHRRILVADPVLAGPATVGSVAIPVTVDPTPTMPTPPPASTTHHAWRTWLSTLWLVLVPLTTFGLFTWAAVVYAAVRLRSRLLGLAAFGYFAVVAWVVVLTGDSGTTEQEEVLATVLLLPVWIGGAVHGQLLRGRLHRMKTKPAYLADPAVTAALTRRARREQALQVLGQDSALARELGIGRPDLGRRYDDGGLVDVNGAPEHVLATLPEVTAWQAARMVAERHGAGGFTSVDELVERGLLSSSAAGALRDRLIFLR